MADPSEMLICSNQSFPEGYLCCNPSLFISQPAKAPDLVSIYDSPQEPRKVIYHIPRSYLENGKAIIRLGAISLSFEKNTLGPGLRVNNKENIQSVSIDLGRAWRNGNSFASASRSHNPLTWDVLPTDHYHGLDYYAPNEYKQSHHHAHIYVPATPNHDFVFVCEGSRPPGKSWCSRQYTPENTDSTLIYWFPSSELKDWKKLESRIKTKIESFKTRT